MTTARDETVRRALEVRCALDGAGVQARLLGGIAIYLLCPSARRPGPVARDYADVDVVTGRAASTTVERVLAPLSLEPARNFNAVHGHTRLLFYFPDGQHVDVFMRRFVMCHELNLEERLGIAPETVSPTDLLLTKLQIAQLNPRDVSDLCALLLDHPTGSDDLHINLPYVASLLSRDWGWWRTVTENLERLASLAGRIGLDDEELERVRRRVGELQGAIEAAPRSRRWRLRARLGDRVAWREEPDEVQHRSALVE
jgi:hypothetical protein